MYLLTDKWQDDFRPKVLERDFHICRLCGDPATDVHHIPKFYPEIFGQEKLEHLTSLCRTCHSNFHCPPGAEDLKKQFFVALEGGKSTNCNVCGRYAKYQPRPLNATMARSLIWIVNQFKENGGCWVDVPREAPQWVTRTNQHTILANWGLLERKPNTEDKHQKHLGLWRPTELGKKFAAGECEVPWKVCLWDSTKIGETVETITISDALSSGGFDYADVMKNPDTEVETILDKKKIDKTSTVKYDREFAAMTP